MKNRQSKILEVVMARFQMGGSGPDDRGLGWIAGLEHVRRFDEPGEVYETDDPYEIEVLRRCPYVKEIGEDRLRSADARRKKSSEECSGVAKGFGSHMGAVEGTEHGRYVEEELKRMKMMELIKIGRGLYRVGMTKVELVNRIIGEGRYLNRIKHELRE